MTSSLTNTPALVKLSLRRDKIMLPAWLYVVVIGVSVNAYELGKLYKTPSSRAQLVSSAQSNPALLFLYGRLNGTSVGALAAWRYGVWGALFAALMTIFLVIRHTRADEEAGRLELIGAARVGRQAPLVSALAVAALANVILTAVLCIVLPILGLPTGGSAALALAIGTCGLAFTGISVVAAQLTEAARAARGLAIGVLGVSFLARAIGDSAGVHGPAWLTWVLPLGWTEMVRPFAGERWWVLALPLAVFAAGTCMAIALAARRDYGAGLLPGRPGRPEASVELRGVQSLAWRLQRGSLAGWAAGAAVLFAVCGAAAQGIGQLSGTSSTLRTEFTRLGGQAQLAQGGTTPLQPPGRGAGSAQLEIVNAYLAGLMLLAGLIAAAYAVATVLRLRGEETDGRADPVLAGTPGRIRWGFSHMLVAAVGSAALLAIAGVATGLGYGLRAAGDPAGNGSGAVTVGGEALRMFGAGVAELPAVLVIAGVAVAAFGLLPRACAGIGWTVVGLAVALNIFGQSAQASRWLLDISPFTHVPHLPGGPVYALPLVWLCVAALALGAFGLAALRRRDIA
jgi:ABC-2 type transport system permease protein